MEWIDALNAVLRSIEEGLSGELDMETLAKSIHFSHFYLQRMFAMLTDMALSEYVRQRRLSAAGQELQTTGAKVIDVALKYGYETPESFQKAFRRFHGVTPSQAKRGYAQLKFLSPLKLQVNLTGGSIMDYRFEHMGEFTIVGMERRFGFEDSFAKVPQFWAEYFQAGHNKVVMGEFGVCIDDEGGPLFSYLIADPCDKDAPAPEGYVKRTIPEHDWVKFKAVGAMPDAIQKVNRQIYSEWLPNNQEFERAANIDLEHYTMGDSSKGDYISEVWLPVRRKKA